MGWSPKIREISGANSWLQTGRKGQLHGCMCFKFSGIFFGKVPGSPPQKNAGFISGVLQPNCCRVNSSLLQGNWVSPTKPTRSIQRLVGCFGAPMMLLALEPRRCCCTKLQSPTFEDTSTSCWWKKSDQPVGSWSHHLQGFSTHPKRWLGMGFLNHQQ